MTKLIRFIGHLLDAAEYEQMEDFHLEEDYGVITFTCPEGSVEFLSAQYGDIFEFRVDPTWPLELDSNTIRLVLGERDNVNTYLQEKVLALASSKGGDIDQEILNLWSKVL